MSELIRLIKENSKQYGMMVALAAIMLLFQIITGGVLLRPINLTNLVLQNSYILILAVGMLLVILSGNIDLSVGSVVAFIGAVAAVMMVELKVNFVLTLLTTLLLGGVIGLWQGYLIAYVKIPGFIVTLAGMLVFRGLALVVLQGQSVGPFPEGFRLISSGFIPGFTDSANLHLPTMLLGAALALSVVALAFFKRRRQQLHDFAVLPLWLLLLQLVLTVTVIMFFSYLFASYKGFPNLFLVLFALFLLYSFLLGQTVPGRQLYALGGNNKAAKLSGVKTEKVLLLVYVNMGIIAALAGLVFASRLNVATPKAGQTFELDAIAACYIGGASATGGIGTVLGAIIGGLFMGVLNNGMSIMGVGIDWQQVIKGMVLLLAVVFDLCSKKEIAYN